MLKSTEGHTIAMSIKFTLIDGHNEETDRYLNQYLPGAVTHMAYMDDVKLYGTNRKALCQAVNTVERVAEETGMRLGKKGT